MLFGAGFHCSEVIICAAFMEENLKKSQSKVLRSELERESIQLSIGFI